MEYFPAVFNRWASADAKTGAKHKSKKQNRGQRIFQFQNHYQVLGVETTAQQQEIKSAYLEKCKMVTENSLLP